MKRKRNIEILKSWNLNEEKLSLKGIHPEFGEVTLQTIAFNLGGSRFNTYSPDRHSFSKTIYGKRRRMEKLSFYFGIKNYETNNKSSDRNNFNL